MQDWICLAKVKGPQPQQLLIVYATKTFSLTAEWFCASNYTYVINNQIIKNLVRHPKKWCGQSLGTRNKLIIAYYEYELLGLFKVLGGHEQG